MQIIIDNSNINFFYTVFNYYLCNTMEIRKARNFYERLAGISGIIIK